MWPKSVFDCEEVNVPVRQKLQSGDFTIGEILPFAERWAEGKGKLIGFELNRSLPHGAILVRPVLEITEASGLSTDMKPGSIVYSMTLGIYVPESEYFKYRTPEEFKEEENG